MRILIRDLRRYVPAAAACLAAAPALYALSRANYLLFHSLVELFCVVVAFGTFTVAWNTRRTLQNGYLLFLGLAMLFVGALDLVHTLAFRGEPGPTLRYKPVTITRFEPKPRTY
jgi:hypothetical protein